MDFLTIKENVALFLPRNIVSGDVLVLSDLAVMTRPYLWQLWYADESNDVVTHKPPTNDINMLDERPIRIEITVPCAISRQLLDMTGDYFNNIKLYILKYILLQLQWLQNRFNMKHILI